MLRQVLGRLELLVHHPRTTLGVALAIVAVSIWLGSGIELRTARSDLVAAGDPAQARWDRLRQEFDGAEPLIVALEGESDDVTVAALERAADDLAARVARLPQVGGVFYRVDLDWLEANLLRLAPPEALETGLDQLAELLGGDQGTIEITGLAAFNRRLAAQIETGLESGSVLPSEDAPEQAEWLVTLLEKQTEFLADPTGFVERLGDRPLELLGGGERGALTAGGYLATQDERILFLMVGNEDGDLEHKERLVSGVRAAAQEVLASHPGVRFGLTGPPAMEVEEMASIGRDGRNTSIFAIIGVFILSLMAFERHRHAWMGLATLGIGTAWALGAVRLELGYLNMITTSLIPILVGMGVGYAVHLLSQYEIERRVRDREEAVLATYRTTTAAVSVSALTTAAAFFCFLFMRFRGFAELGLVTGVGVVLCLIASLCVLPALLMLRGAGADPLGRRPDERAMVDRVWNRATALHVCRFPRSVVALAAAATIISALAATQVKLEPSLLELLPASAESLRYLQVMNRDSELSNDLNIVIAKDLDELGRLEEMAGKQATIERFESILDFLPQQPEVSDRALHHAETVLAGTHVGSEGSSSEEVAESLRRLESALADAADAAFVTGLGDLAAVLERGRQQAELAVGKVEGGQEASRLAAERRLLEKAASLVASLRVAAAAPAPTLESLPREIVDRFVTSRGRYLGYLHPAGDIYELDFLGAFNQDSAVVSSGAIGFPVVFEHHTRMITGGFEVAFAVGGGLIFLLLLIDLRRPVHTLLALTPVVIGTVWMLGLMRLLDLDFNLANLVAVPIVLGVGIDGGVHVIHRFRLEGATGLTTVVAHTGRAVLIASLTTMVGFGSVALAAHRGMASLGLLLLVGVATCLVATLVFLPNLLLVLGLARR